MSVIKRNRLHPSKIKGLYLYAEGRKHAVTNYSIVRKEF
jgi:hypothetical protein